MEHLIQKTRKLNYNSVEYIDLDDIVDAKVFLDTESCIVIYSELKDKVTLYWGAATKEDFINVIKDVIRSMQNKKLYLEFIPEAFVDNLEDLGFVIVSEFLDFWKNDLKTLENPNMQINIRKMEDDKNAIVAGITKACKGSSRGFMGETKEFITEWSNTEHSFVFVAEYEEEIVGMCCLNLYGFDSEKGTVLWIREIAVSPTYQSKGIGHELLAFAINWGIDNGAKRSFLACDADNTKAIKIYESFGYKRASKRGQINMQR